MNSPGNLIDEIAEYLAADAILRTATTPARTGLDIAAGLIRRVPRWPATPAQFGFRLRLEDEILCTSVAEGL